MGLILAALVAVVVVAVPGTPVHKKANLGLDLQGGLEVVLQAVPPANSHLTSSGLSDALDRSVSIMRTRVDKLGVSEPEIRKQSNNQIVIELPGVKNAATAEKLIGKTAQLQLFDLETSVTGPSASAAVGGQPRATPSLYQLLSAVKAQAGNNSTSWYVFDKKHDLRAGPLRHRADAFNTKVLRRENGKLSNGWAVLAVPLGPGVMARGEAERLCTGGA